MFWQKEMETASRRELDEIQLQNLKWVVAHCYRNIEFYHKRLDAAGVTPESIRSLDDIRRIPFTTKEDIRNNYPYGLFGAPMKQIVRLHASSGTTGKPTVVGYTRRDLDTWSDLVARIVVAAGATDEDVVQISFGYGLFTGALGLHYGLERLGAAIVPASSGNTQKQVMLLHDFGATALVSTPSYALYIGEVARELGYKREDFKLRLGLFGSEGCTVEMRDQIERELGIFATDNYGMSELMGPGVSGECTERCGMHIWEDHFLPEIIDSQTLERKAPGELGELVITTITKEGFPMLRYRTKDITRLNYQPCACGRSHVRMDKVTGRSDDMLKIRGVNVFPSQIETVLMSVAEVGPHYQLLVRRQGFMDTLEVKVELLDAGVLEKYSQLEQVETTIRQKLKEVLGIDVSVTLSNPKSMQRFEGKAQRIVDLRGK